MDILKKNWLSVLCGVIALAAVAAVPLFINSQKKDLQKKLDARAATHRDITNLLQKQRHQPVVSTDPNATAPELGVFPGPTVIQAGKNAIEKVHTQSQALEQAAIEMNRKKLLVEGSLPSPVDTFAFQQTYSKEMKTGIPERLNSVTPPTEKEITAQMEVETKKLEDLEPKNQVNGEFFNKGGLDEKIAKMKFGLPDKMKSEAANEHKVYMDPLTALSIDPAIQNAAGGVNQLSAETIWLAQLGLWVQQDVVDTITELNKNSKTVADSPVKQLVKIEASPGRDIYTLPGGASATSPLPAAGQPAASAVAANNITDALPRDNNASPTGRVCNGVFDVVHFTVCLNVQGSDVTKVIQGLEKGRLLTVYQSDVEAVSSAQLVQEGYFFGPRPVVTLTLKCEELFLRSWTRPYMPPSIKQFLNVQEPPAQPTALAN